MKSDFVYDLLIIGGGIPACIFASKYLQSNSRKKIALVEVGRGLGGRSSTRISNRYKGWKINHGAPNLNICNSKKDQIIKNYIDELLDNNLIEIDDSELNYLEEESNLGTVENSEFSCGANYRSCFSMRQLSQNIIGFKSLNENIDFYFETLIVDLKFNKKEWNLISKNGEQFKAKYLVCSTNLLLHKRSMEILKLNQIPLRKAIPKNKDKGIDLLLYYLEKQSFLPRLTFLIYPNENYSYRDIYSKNNRYFYLNKTLEDKYKFERIIFQNQDFHNLGIVVHTKNINFFDTYIKSNGENLLSKKIFTNFNKLFEKNPYINQLTGNENMSIMKWRASQPIGYAVPLSLQFSRKYKIGFCGDWFNGDGFGRIEGSIMSALMLANKFSKIN